MPSFQSNIDSPSWFGASLLRFFLAFCGRERRQDRLTIKTLRVRTGKSVCPRYVIFYNTCQYLFTVRLLFLDRIFKPEKLNGTTQYITECA